MRLKTDSKVVGKAIPITSSCEMLDIVSTVCLRVAPLPLGQCLALCTKIDRGPDHRLGLRRHSALGRLTLKVFKGVQI